MNTGGENPPEPTEPTEPENMVAPGNPVQDAPVDAAAPSKKETSLREFLGKMDDYAPIVCFNTPFLPDPIPIPPSQSQSQPD